MRAPRLQPDFKCPNPEGRRFYVEARSHDNLSGHTSQWSCWKSTLDDCLAIIEDTEARKVALDDIWDDHAKRWLAHEELPETLREALNRNT